MIRVLAALFALVVSWLGLVQPSAAAPLPKVAATGYTYDSPRTSSHVGDTATERGPPASYVHAIATYDTAGSWPGGASARPNGRITLLATTHTTPAPSAATTATTGGQVVVPDGGSSPVDRVGVAAKPAVGFAEGLGHTALTPGRLQHGTKNLTKAGVLPAWSGKTSPGIIERAFTPILEHPAATFDHTLGGTRVRGFLGDINGKQVAAFVYKEGPYQGQLASSFVPSANQLKMWGVP